MRSRHLRHASGLRRAAWVLPVFHFLLFLLLPACVIPGDEPGDPAAKAATISRLRKFSTGAGMPAGPMMPAQELMS